eukprot:TRINITY_DN62444_c0_g1_i1.p1 TRINITY_DN62444_c0_g1~~TRINITY_DN62444_c0_g1_i1.p1  ORF type:complete len:244 (+),score=56.82 TRINITY_DN62444_c0_g1_i1:46-732(+)
MLRSLVGSEMCIRDSAHLKQALESSIFTAGGLAGGGYKSKLGASTVTSELMRILESPSAEDAVLHSMLHATLERGSRASKGRVSRPRCLQCDSCLSLQHGGAVFKCAVCPHYVLCTACEQQGSHPHPMLYITNGTKVPKFVSATVRESPGMYLSGGGQMAVHHDVICDSCNAAPIWGARFKCCVCDNFELCSQCIQQVSPGLHDSTHVFLKIPNPTMLPDSIAIEIDD